MAVLRTPGGRGFLSPSEKQAALPSNRTRCDLSSVDFRSEAAVCHHQRASRLRVGLKQTHSVRVSNQILQILVRRAKVKARSEWNRDYLYRQCESERRHTSHPHAFGTSV